MSESPDEKRPPKVDWEAFYGNYRSPGYIPGYEITSKLGGGMFGLVYRAQKQSIGKDYAIKFLKVDDDVVRRAVLGELESVRHFAQVDHPNLVAIEDRGEVDGIPFIVMAYAGDQTLRDRLDDRESRAEDLVLFFLQACRGVQALHERSLVHFDLKPANVFIRGSVARVGDYGLSKLVAHSRNTLSMGRGTPYYMAPEILKKQGDARSDIYSLGVILYECLTGRVPFSGDSEWEVLRQHETAAPAYPDEMPQQHRDVIDRCLAKDPEQRFASANEIIAALGVPATGFYASAEPSSVGDGATAAAGLELGAADAELSEDPAESFKKAAREFSVHAKRMASEAVKTARPYVNKAMHDASRAMRREMRRHRAQWGWKEFKERREERRQRKTEARLLARRQWEMRRRLHRGTSWWGPLLLVALIVFLAMLFVGGPAPSSPMAVTSGAIAPAPDWRAAAQSGDLVTANRQLRSRLQWAKDVLPRELDEIRRWSAPHYRLEVNGLSRKTLEAALQDARLVAEGTDGASGELATRGFAGLVAAVQLLEAEKMLEPESLERADRLNDFLQSAVGFREISLVPGGAKGANEVNKRAAGMWRWLLYSFVPDPKSYELYRTVIAR